MLKWLLALAIGANALVFGYAQGWFDGLFGLHSIGDREPERLRAQVRPETVLLLPWPASSPAAAARCLEAGPFAAGDAAAAEATLRSAVPEGSWRLLGLDGAAASGPLAVATIRVDNAEPPVAARLGELRLGPAARAFAPCP